MQDLRFGVVAAVVANVHGNKKSAADFFKSLRQEKRRPKTPRQMVSFLEHLTATFGGIDARKGSDGADSN